MNEIIFPAAVFLLFYLILPLIGAFYVRAGWRGFRRNMLSASLAPEPSYSDPSRQNPGPAGKYRFLGTMEAIQKDSTVWVSNGRLSVRAEMGGGPVYLMPGLSSARMDGGAAQDRVFLPEDMPKRTSWKRVYSLPQGTGILLYGNLYIEDGEPVFRSDPSEPLFAVIFDGEPSSLLRRSIWSGRQLNEYWNALTPASLAAGAVILSVSAYVGYRTYSPSYRTASFIVAGLVPLLPYLPPGLFLFMLYKRLWRAGRLLRAERDMLLLPLRYFKDGKDSYSAADGRFYTVHRIENSIKASEDFPDAVFRSCGLAEGPGSFSAECTVFTCRTPDGNPCRDPFFEQLVIPGDPERLSRECRHRARLMELSAAAVFGIGCGINALCMFLLVNNFV